MKNFKSHFSKIFAFTFAFTLAFVFLASSTEAKSTNDDKLSTEEILEKHLQSIGTKEARSSVVSIMASGTAQAVAKGRGAGETAGAVVIASEGKKNLIGMRFDNNDYPYEKMGYDGKEFTVGFLQPGQRSIFGSFLLLNESTFTYGILGGVLSTGWELLDYNEKVGKLKCKGTSKIDEVDHYKCKYEPKKSDLNITFYFHPETFRHVRTEYKRVVAGKQGLGIDNSARQNEVRFTLTEDFSNFKTVNGLTLPQTYKMSYEMLTGNGTSLIDWNMQLSNFIFNEKIDTNQFKVDTY